MNSALNKMLARGDHISIGCGRLMINPASGKQVPSEWLKTNNDKLVRGILTLVGMDAYWYVGYKPGRYGAHKTGAVTLRFVSAVTSEPFYAIFNVDLKRKRSVNGKLAGSPLPEGRFIVGERSAFLQFWNATGLSYHRLSDFHDYMGKLKAILFAGEARNEDGKFVNSTLRPVNIGVKELAAVTTSTCKLSRLMPIAGQGGVWKTSGNFPTRHPTRIRQTPDNNPTRLPDKEIQQGQQTSGLQTFSTACDSNRVIKLTSNDVYKPASKKLDAATVATDMHDYQQLVDLVWGLSLPVESQLEIGDRQQSAYTEINPMQVGKAFDVVESAPAGLQIPALGPALSPMTEPAMEAQGRTISLVWDDSDVEEF